MWPAWRPRLLPPRDVPWQLRPLESATTHEERLADGRLRWSIRHDLLRGVTPRMLVWWFQHLEGPIEIGGQTLERYLVWHPVDHIAVHYVRRAVDGGIGPGAQIHITEMLGGNPDFLVDIVSTVERLDEGGFAHGEWVAGLQVARLDYTFTPVADGTLYANSLTVGAAAPFLGPLFNRLVRPWMFDAAMGRAWLRHNVEEVGSLEHFLPGLFAREAR